MTVVTADGFTVFRSRRGKYAEEDSYDSLLAGTMLVSDVDGPDYSTDQYLRMLVAEARLDGDGVVTEFHPTHLAMRKADFGLWIGGWISVSLTAGEVKEAVPFDTVAVGMGSPVPMPLTPWGQFDLDAARTHLDGRHLRQALWLP